MNAATAAMYARRSANTLLQTIWIDRGFPIDPAWIAGKLGVTVIEAELPETVQGSLVKDMHRDPVIMLNQLDEQSQKRFNCAHKIGHFADHQLHQDDFYKHLALREEHARDDPNEVFANRFGIELLMPLDEMERLQSEGRSTALMAQHFGVTEDLIQERLEETRLCA